MADAVDEDAVVTSYVALLAGVNIGAKTTIAMAELRRVFADLGFAQVRSYIQSGNVVFQTPAQDERRLISDIQAAIQQDLGQQVDLLLRTGSELAAVLSANPFKDRQEDPTKLLITFLAEKPAADRVAKLVPPAGETGELELVGREVFVNVPDGYGRSKLSNAFVAKALGVPATTRNWRSVAKLHELVAAAG